MHFPPFGKANAIGIELLEKYEKQKMKFPNLVMVGTRSSGKSTYVLWLPYFDEGETASQIAWCRPLWIIGYCGTSS